MKEENRKHSCGSGFVRFNDQLLVCHVCVNMERMKEQHAMQFCTSCNNYRAQRPKDYCSKRWKHYTEPGMAYHIILPYLRVFKAIAMRTIRLRPKSTCHHNHPDEISLLQGKDMHKLGCK